MRKTVAPRLLSTECNTASDHSTMRENVLSPAVAKLTLELYEKYVSADVGNASPARRLSLQPNYNAFVQEAAKQIRLKNPDFRQGDRASKARRRTHRIGPHLYETAALESRNDALPVSARARLQRTVDGVIGDFCRRFKNFRARVVWAKLLGHLTDRGVQAVLKNNETDIRLDSISWHVEGEEGCKTYAQFERLFTQARKPEALIAG